MDDFEYLSGQLSDDDQAWSLQALNAASQPCHHHVIQVYQPSNLRFYAVICLVSHPESKLCLKDVFSLVTPEGFRDVLIP